MGILARGGDNVLGKPFEEAFVFGENSQGVICGPQEMGWTTGDPTICVLLADTCEVGDPAPSSAKSPLISKDEEAEEDAEEEVEEKKKGPAEEKKAKKGKVQVAS